MKTEWITINSDQDAQQIRKTAQMLNEGKLVAFPTETVYGIGCQAEPSAIQRLDEVKDRQLDKRYTLHVGNYEQLKLYVPKMNLRAGKLVNHMLPGPLTIVFQFDDKTLDIVKERISPGSFELLYSQGTLGVRWPDNSVACEILSQAQAPIIAPSANPAGREPATTAKQVKEYFDGRIDAIVEAPDSSCNYNQSSTVVKIGNSKIDILREGAITRQQIEDISTIQIVFVCTGNTCRSPMAEGFARLYFAERLNCSVDEVDRFGYKLSSAGVAAFGGAPASRHAIEVCSEYGIDLSKHQSRQLSDDNVDDYDLIFVMGKSHRNTIIEYWPQLKDKCLLLDENSDIADPVGMDVNVYRRCFEQIKEAIKKRTQDLL